MFYTSTITSCLTTESPRHSIFQQQVNVFAIVNQGSSVSININRVTSVVIDLSQHDKTVQNRLLVFSDTINNLMTICVSSFCCLFILQYSSTMVNNGSSHVCTTTLQQM